MSERSNKLGRFEKLLRCFDSKLRRWDRVLCNTFWDDEQKNESGWRRWARALRWPDGHLGATGLICLLLIAAITLGPNLSPSSWGRGFTFALAAIIYFALVCLASHWRKTEEWHFGVQVTALCFACFLLWMRADSSDTQASGGPFLNALIAVIPGLILLVVMAYFIARAFLGNRGAGENKPGDLAEYLPLVELHRVRLRSTFASTSWWHALLVVPFMHTVPLLFPGAVLSLFPFLYFLFPLGQPGQLSLILMFGIPTIFTGLILAMGTANDRFRQAIWAFGEMFFSPGPQLVLSVVIIVLAILRLADVSYVSYLFNSSSDPMNWTLFAYVCTLYGMSWFYAYWTDRFLVIRILDLFRDQVPSTQRKGRVDYRYKGSAKTEVLSAGRMLQIHGASRILALGTYEKVCKDEVKRGEAFHAYSPLDLLEEIQGYYEGRQIALEDKKCADYRNAVFAASTARVVRHRARFYSGIATVLFFAAIGAGGLWIRGIPVKAEMELIGSEPVEFRLGDQLRSPDALNLCDEKRGDRPRVVLALSGGGTRAALYGASVLGGLASAGHLCDVVLISTVSGGSATLAYFLGHAEALTAGDPKREDTTAESGTGEWERFNAAMAKPFIEEAIEGVLEWRIILGLPGEPGDGAREVWMRTRTGDLLAESFARHFNLPENGDSLKDVRNVGVIFNTALAGHFPRWPWQSRKMSELEESGIWTKARFWMPGDRPICPAAENSANKDGQCYAQCGDTLPERENNCGELNSGEHAGGRLVVTNLNPALFDERNTKPKMAYVALNHGEASLVRAAALSANFPPVFPYAAVDSYGLIGENSDTAGNPLGMRYWVTDGGGVDNRGVLSALLALRKEVDSESGKACSTDERIPPLHIIVADASAVDFSFGQDRGIGSTFGASSQLASGLSGQLVQEIGEYYECRGSKVHYHQLTMPTVLRSDGIGTHWMLPSSVAFQRPVTVRRSEMRYGIDLSGETVRLVIEQLHHDLAGVGLSGSSDAEDLKLLKRWIKKDSYRNHPKRWKALLSCLGGDDRSCLSD